MSITEKINTIARKKECNILMVDGESKRVIKAAEIAIKEKICKPTLLGSKEVIEKTANEESISLDGVDILEVTASEEEVKKLVELREHKGMNEAKATEMLKNNNAYGALMLKIGKFDAALGGCKASTAEWMRPVFQIVGSKGLVSAICFMEFNNKVYFFSDTDFNIVPNEEQLAQIAINAAKFVRGLDIEPKVALLSYSSKGSGEHACLEPIRNALKMVKEKDPDLIIDGELQVDAAINPDAAAKKVPDSILKGEANVLVFPSITVGNVLIHSLLQFTDMKFYGSFPVGLNMPVVNGGRSMTPEQIYDLVVAACMMANLNG